MLFYKDPIGFAIHDFQIKGNDKNIIVESDLCDDDIIPVKHLFRTYEEMPEFEKKAMDLCKGKILDIGAAAGAHSIHLKDKGKDVFAIDSSKGAIEYLSNINIDCSLTTILAFNDSKYDTIICLMNGLGLAGEMKKLNPFLLKLKSLLNPKGKIYIDSTDISYLFEAEDGSVWINLNQKHHGEMMFRMKYKNIDSDWFSWLYLDFKTLVIEANKNGLNCKLIAEDDNNSYLAELSII